MKQKLQFLMTVIATVMFGSISMAQCPGGEAELTVSVTTDSWGYETYWEMTPQGDACGTNTVAAYGNTLVGCAGEGLQVAGGADPGAYGNDGFFTEVVGCFTVGSCYTIHLVDDWGDAPSALDIMVGGTSVATIDGAGGSVDFCIDLQVANDLAVDSAGIGTYYTYVPLAQVAPLSFEATVFNNGSAAAMNAMANVLVNGVATDATAPTASLAPGASATTAGTVGYTATSLGMVDIDFVASMTDVDGNPGNDMITVSIMYNDSILARDNGVVLGGSLGIGAANANGVLGHTYMSPVADELTSITVIIVAPVLGDSTRFSVWDMTGGTPTAEIASSLGYEFTAADTLTAFNDGFLTLTLPLSTPLAAAAGTEYMVACHEYANNITIATSANVYELGTNWVNWDTNPNGPAFSNAEAFNLGSNLHIRANFGVDAGASINENILTSANVYPNPTNGIVNIELTEEVSDASIVVYSVDGTIVSTDVVSGAQFSVNLEGLSKGIYIIELNNGSNTGVYRIVKD